MSVVLRKSVYLRRFLDVKLRFIAVDGSLFSMLVRFTAVETICPSF